MQQSTQTPHFKTVNTQAVTLALMVKMTMSACLQMALIMPKYLKYATKAYLPSNNTTWKQVYELFQSTITRWTTKNKIQHSVLINEP